MHSRKNVIFHQKKAPAGMQSRNQVIFQQKRKSKSVHKFAIFFLYIPLLGPYKGGWTPLPWNSYLRTNAQRPYGHVYFVLHKKCTIPRKGFEKGICKEGWYEFPWRRPFRGSALEGLCWLSGDVKKTYREG